jgi:outer membrane protein
MRHRQKNDKNAAPDWTENEQLCARGDWFKVRCQRILEPSFALWAGGNEREWYMRRMIGVALLGLCLPVCGNAAQDLIQAYEAARIYDPQHNAARYDLDAALEKLPQASAELLPNISFDARTGKVNQDVKERDQQIFGVGDTRYTSSAWNLQARQPVFRWSSWIQRSQAKNVVRQAYAEYTAAEQDLILRTVALYLNFLAARDLMALSNAELTALGRQLDLVKAQRRGGLASITDEYEAQARYSFVQADVIEAEYGIEDAYQGLREVVGNAVTEVYPLREEIALIKPEPADVAAWVDSALEQNLLLIAREEAVLVAESEVTRQRAEHYPTFDLVANYGNRDDGGSVTGGATNVDTADFSLQVRVPLYTGGAVNSRTREAQMNYRRALEEQRFQYGDVDRQTRAAYNGVVGSISRVEALKASTVAQESVLEGRKTGYRSGVSTLLDVLASESILYSTRRDYAEARYQYLLRLLQLKRQAGTLSEEDVYYINGLLQIEPVTP